MKTKIFVCSSSEINEIKHSKNIEAIPFLYRFSDDEIFEDEIELKTNAVYNRLRFDRNSNLELLSISHERVSEYLKKAIADGYDNAFFILPNRSTINLAIPVKIALEENKEINVAMYQSNEVSLPLAYIALTAEKLFDEGLSIVETWNKLVLYEGISKIYIFNPQNNSERSSNFEKTFKNGTFNIFKGGKLISANDNKKINSLEIMIDEFRDDISDKEVMPFILTSNKASKYNEILLNNLVEIEDEKNKTALEKIRFYDLPLCLGLATGIDSIAIGYIEPKNGIILEKK